MQFSFRQLALAAICCGGVFAQSPPKPDSADMANWRAKVEQAWKTHQERLPRFIVEWTEQRTSSMGHHVPRGGVTHAVRYRMVGDGPKMRLTRDGMDFGHPSSAVAAVEQHFTKVFDGRLRKDLYTNEIIRNLAHGFLKDDEFEEFGSHLVGPVLWQVRPSSRAHGGVNLAEWKKSDRSGMMGGVSCRILERFILNAVTHTREEQMGRELLWIADHPRFPIVRYQSELPDRSVLQDCSLEFNAASDLSHFIGQWKWVQRVAPPLQTAETAVIRKATIQFPSAVRAEEFELAFPPGALLTDHSTGQIAVVRADGSIRGIDRSDTWKTTEQILSTEPPPNSPLFPGERRASRWPFTWLAVGAVSAAVLLGGLTATRYVRRRTMQ